MEELHDIIPESPAARVYSRLMSRYQKSHALNRVLHLERLFSQKASDATFVPCLNNYRR